MANHGVSVGPRRVPSVVFHVKGVEPVEKRLESCGVCIKAPIGIVHRIIYGEVLSRGIPNIAQCP